ncbi:MAG TPA: site-specific DNA-methyltransferase, partial [Firmicutes bacterium]|nr:site-specific DNA-methyltransferase [Bacillota bacterium]
DDNEVHNLRKICDEIFGEDTFIANIVWQKKYSPQNDATYFSDMHDHIIVYVKNKKQSKNDPVGWQRNLLPRSKGQNKRYSNPDNDPRGPWMSDNLTVKTYTPDNDYEIITPSGRIVNPSEGRCWALSKERFQELVDDNRIWFGVNKNNVPRLKRFLSEVQDGRVPVTWWTRKECGDNQEARRELINIMDNVDVVFDTPKPVRLIKKILQIATNEQDIIMDFFSGSATTAHAVMQLNAEDNGKRKFIMVQLPERLAKEEKNLDGVVLPTIADIGKERIRRAGEQIKQDLIEKQKGQLILDIDEQSAIDPDDLDLGFKVFKLDSSNIKKWNPDYDNLEQSLFDNIDNYVVGRTELDVVYEIMLKYGIDLTYPIEEYIIDGKRVYSIGLGALMICLDDEITEAVAEGMIEINEELKPEIIRAVFKDNGFKNDCLKTNIKEMFKCAGIDEFVTL